MNPVHCWTLNYTSVFREVLFFHNMNNMNNCIQIEPKAKKSVWAGLRTTEAIGWGYSQLHLVVQSDVAKQTVFNSFQLLRQSKSIILTLWKLFKLLLSISMQTAVSSSTTGAAELIRKKRNCTLSVKRKYKSIFPFWTYEEKKTGWGIKETFWR